jgi:DNA-binding NarL/FixJ family response regulator
MRGCVLRCHAYCVALRLVIADDNERFLETARVTLERDGIEVVGTATTAAAAVELVERLGPDVVLVDISLGEDSGFELARRLAARNNRSLRVLLISTHDGEDFAELIKRSPAIGFMSKYDFSARGIHELLAADGG